MSDEAANALKFEARKSMYAVHPLILSRWSPRALSGEPMTDELLMTLFEAARWAPSSYNNQPWRFLYARKGTPHWEVFFNLPGDFNKSWTAQASVLVVIISKKTFDFNGQPSVTHSFDTGSAWQNLALQAAHMGFVAHGMEGFDYEKARGDLHVPDDFSVEAMVAIGLPGDKNLLPEKLQEREMPSQRKPLYDIVIEGGFSA